MEVDMARIQPEEMVTVHHSADFLKNRAKELESAARLQDSRNPDYAKELRDRAKALRGINTNGQKYQVTQAGRKTVMILVGGIQVVLPKKEKPKGPDRIKKA